MFKGYSFFSWPFAIKNAFGEAMPINFVRIVLFGIIMLFLVYIAVSDVFDRKISIKGIVTSLGIITLSILTYTTLYSCICTSIAILTAFCLTILIGFIREKPFKYNSFKNNTMNKLFTISDIKRQERDKNRKVGTGDVMLFSMFIFNYIWLTIYSYTKFSVLGKSIALFVSEKIGFFFVIGILFSVLFGFLQSKFSKKLEYKKVPIMLGLVIPMLQLCYFILGSRRGF